MMELQKGHMYNLNGIHIFGFTTKGIVRFEDAMYTGTRNGEEDFFLTKIIHKHFAPDMDRLRIPEGRYTLVGDEAMSNQIVREVSVLSWESHSDGVKKYLVEALALAASPPASGKKHEIKLQLLHHIAPPQHIYGLGKRMGFSEDELRNVNRTGPVDQYQQAVMEAFPHPISIYLTDFKPLEDIIRS